MDRTFNHILIIFLAIWASNCSSSSSYWLVESVGSFVSTVGHYVAIVANGAEKVAIGIQTLETIINDAIEEECEFLCPNGKVPRPNPYHRPHPNGCGSMGVKWEKDLLPLEQLSNCCDQHDICYDTCNENKDDCDKTFKSCLYKLCDKYKNTMDQSLLTRCKAAAKLMFTGTIALGCTSYKEAQAEACICEQNRNEEL